MGERQRQVDAGSAGQRFAAQRFSERLTHHRASPLVKWNSSACCMGVPRSFPQPFEYTPQFGPVREIRIDATREPVAREQGFVFGLSLLAGEYRLGCLSIRALAVGRSHATVRHRPRCRGERCSEDEPIRNMAGANSKAEGRNGDLHPRLSWPDGLRIFAR